MTRFLAPFSSAARRAIAGDHLRVRSIAAGSQRDLVAVLTRDTAPASRARLTNFRRAIQG